MLALYTLSIRVYALLARVAALFNKKAALWTGGRGHWKGALAHFSRSDKVVWFHCASVGEFEQARPIMESLKKSRPDIGIAVTFFSPSGYEVRKDYKYADVVTYLPTDTPANARRFLDALRPDIALFVKYDFWFNFMNELHRRHIPGAVISAYIPDEHWLLKWPGSVFIRRLGQFDRLFLQDRQSEANLARFGLNKTIVCGDTRIDRVLANRQEPWSAPKTEAFCRGRKVLVIGSNWPKDDDVLLPVISTHLDRWAVIVAPHEMHDAQWLRWSGLFGGQIVRWSELETANLDGKNVLYVDTIGVLSKLYRFATVAYIGGGFSGGIHNTLEAAVYGVPVIFGPDNRRFLEAQQLKAIGVGFEVNDDTSLARMLDHFDEAEKALQEIPGKAEQFFRSQQGASERILGWVREKWNRKQIQGSKGF